MKHLAGKIGCIVERPMIKTSDIIICASHERSEIMQEVYKLKEAPLVYENLRRLEYESPDSFHKAEERFRYLIHDSEIRIIASYGCDASRHNDILVKNIPRVKKKCRLILAGWSSESDERLVRNIIQSLDIRNVEITGRLTHTELLYLIRSSHIGIVNYDSERLNDKFCASGKLYEFIYEGLPVVTTSNPPLKRLCNEWKIGSSYTAYSYSGDLSGRGKAQISCCAFMVSSASYVRAHSFSRDSRGQIQL